MGVWGFFQERFSSHTPFRSKERLFWKPLSHVHPMLVVKNFQYNFKRSSPHKIFEEQLKKETSFQFMAVLITNLPKLRCPLSLSTDALAQMTKDISYL